ncbi:MAG: Tim44 domain-containing protein [Bacteroidota bacterium]
MNRILIVIAILILQTTEVLAGPGGKIAKELFDSPLGKIVGVILFIIFLPLIIRSYYKKNKAVRETKKKLAQLANVDFELFDEINLKNRMTDIFSRVHKAWSERDLDNCREYMTNWYRQNQQTVFLDEWDSKGLMNVCTIQKINSIKPIHIRITADEHFNGSRIMYAINANMEDYLVGIEDSSVIEGKKGFKDVETVWTLKLEDNVWKVDNIEQSEMVSSYLKMESQLSDSFIEKLTNKNVV